MAPKEFPDFPEKAHGEGAYQVARISLGAADLVFPLLGQALQQLVDRLVGEPLNKRRNAWFQKVAEKIQHMPDDLLSNEDFVSTVIDATFAAMKTRFEEKQEALANAVANMAVGFEIDEVLRGAFISYVDRFSPQHLTVLRLLDDPRLDANQAAKAVQLLDDSSRGELGGAFVPKDDDLVYSRVLDDLRREGLISASQGRSPPRSIIELQRSTTIGRKFLAFISVPPS